MSVIDNDIRKGVEILSRNGATRVWLFGSALETPETARDVDLACEGVAPERFFRVVSELLDAMDKPVDLVDVSVKNRLAQYILKKGRQLYGPG